MKTIIYIALAGLTILSCKKKAEEVSPVTTVIPTSVPKNNPDTIKTIVKDTTKPVIKDSTKPAFNNIHIKFKTVAGSSDFELYTDYINASREKFRVSRFQYFLSNFELTMANGSKFKIPNSYFLLNADAKDSVLLASIPNAEYTGITFMIGVDSTKSLSGAHSGDLDPANNMFMEWSGYTYVALEGLYGLSTPDKDFRYIIRGFTPYPYYAVQTVSYTFGKNINLDKSKRLLFHVDVLEIFKNPSDFIIGNKPKIDVASEDAVQFSRRYKDMFSLIKTEDL